jgi:group I intron endonuclease
MDNCGIYIIKNKVNCKCYIGQSVNIKKRFIWHKSLLQRNKHYNDYLQKSFNKHGLENFEFSTYIEVDRNELNDYEILVIRLLKDDGIKLYNANDGGKQALNVSDITRAKLGNKSREGWAKKTEEDKSNIALKRWSKFTKEERSEIARKRELIVDKDKRIKSAKNAWIDRTKEQRSNIIKKSWLNKTTEERREHMKKCGRNLTKEQLSINGKKGALKTIRIKKIKKFINNTYIPFLVYNDASRLDAILDEQNKFLCLK